MLNLSVPKILLDGENTRLELSRVYYLIYTLLKTENKFYKT
jgi:hypothetical protein